MKINSQMNTGHTDRLREREELLRAEQHEQEAGSVASENLHSNQNSSLANQIRQLQQERAVAQEDYTRGQMKMDALARMIDTISEYESDGSMLLDELQSRIDAIISETTFNDSRLIEYDAERVIRDLSKSKTQIRSEIESLDANMSQSLDSINRTSISIENVAADMTSGSLASIESATEQFMAALATQQGITSGIDNASALKLLAG